MENFIFCAFRCAFCAFRCPIWYQSLFSVCMIDHTNNFFYRHAASIRLYELAWCSNWSIKFQTLECQSYGLRA